MLEVSHTPVLRPTEVEAEQRFVRYTTLDTATAWAHGTSRIFEQHRRDDEPRKAPGELGPAQPCGTDAMSTNAMKASSMVGGCHVIDLTVSPARFSRIDASSAPRPATGMCTLVP